MDHDPYANIIGANFPPAQPPMKIKRQTTYTRAIVTAVSFGVTGIVIGMALGAPADPDAYERKPIAPAPAKSSAQTVKPAQEKPSDKTIAQAASWGDGDYEVGTDIETGTYVSTGAAQDGIQLCVANTEDRDGNFVDMKSGGPGEQVLIRVTESTAVLSIAGCEPFAKR